MAQETIFWALTAGVAGLGIVGLVFWSFRTSGKQRRAFDAGQAYLKGVQYLLSDDPDAAIEELTRVVRVDTETIETYFALGALFRRKGEVERAIRIHQNIILRPGLPEPTRAQARFELALDFLKAGMHTQAREALAQVVEDGPSYKERYLQALAHLRDLAAAEEEWAEAADAQRRRMKVLPSDESAVLAHLLAGLARQLAEKGKGADARRTLKDALKDCPNSVDAHLAAADLARQEEDFKTARKHYDAALGQIPEAATLAYPGLADLFFKTDDYEALTDYLRDHVMRQPDVPELRLALARNLRSRGLTDRAVEELRAALDVAPGFNDARQELGRILLEEDMGTELKRQFEALLEAIGAQPGFRCAGCGHAVPSLSWQCPGCGAWDTIRRPGGSA